MAIEFGIPVILHGDALVELLSGAFQLTLAEVRSYFDKPGRDVTYCGRATNHTWRPVTLAEGVPLEGGTVQVGALRELRLPQLNMDVKIEFDALGVDRIAATVVEMVK